MHTIYIYLCIWYSHRYYTLTRAMQRSCIGFAYNIADVSKWCRRILMRSWRETVDGGGVGGRLRAHWDDGTVVDQNSSSSNTDCGITYNHTHTPHTQLLHAICGLRAYWKEHSCAEYEIVLYILYFQCVWLADAWGSCGYAALSLHNRYVYNAELLNVITPQIHRDIGIETKSFRLQKRNVATTNRKIGKSFLLENQNPEPNIFLSYFVLYAHRHTHVMCRAYSSVGLTRRKRVQKCTQFL